MQANRTIHLQHTVVKGASHIFLKLFMSKKNCRTTDLTII